MAPNKTSLNKRDINDAWLRALAEYSEWVSAFSADILGNDANVAIGMAFEKAQQVPGLADMWKQQDPESYKQAALIAGHKEV